MLSVISVAKNNHLSGSTRLFIFCLVLLTIGFRIVHLDADPPSSFDWSGGYFADEGFWAHNARNEILFGNPVSDEWDARVVSPIFATIQKWIFQAFGIGLIQVRIVGIVSSIFIVVCSFFLFRLQFDPPASFLLSLLVSLNYPMLVLGRQGILDPFAAALALGALLLVLTERSTLAFIAGLLFLGACITKYLMIYAFVPLLFALSLAKQRGIWMTFIAGFIAAATLWLVRIYIPNTELFGSYSAYYSSQQSWELPGIAKNIVLQPFYLYFIKTPAILFFGNLSLWYFLAKPKGAGKIEKICWLWLFSGIVFFAVWRYRPLRYYTSLIPPLAALAGVAVLRLKEIEQAFRTGSFRWLLWLGIFVPVVQVLFVLADRWMGWGFIPEQVGIQTVEVILFLLLTMLFLSGRLRWMVPAFIVVFLISDIRNYVSWMARPEYAAVEISEDLQQRVGAGVITGQWAPELCLQNKIRVVPVWQGFVNATEPFEKYGITHILQWQYPLGGEKFGEWYPEEFRRFEPIAHYRIKDSDLVLYEMRDEGRKTRDERLR